MIFPPYPDPVKLYFLRIQISVIGFLSCLFSPAEPVIEAYYNPLLKPFFHGVASGDPTADGCIIWTRVTPDFESRVEISYTLSEGPDMVPIRAAGVVTTSGERDFTVKIDIDGLEADSTYYYQFHALGRSSIVGRFRTAPDQPVEELRFAVAVCSSFEWGYFAAYEHMAHRDDLNAVIFLGDYFYEYADNDPYSAEAIRDQRQVFPVGEAITLEDYRLRYATHRLDPQLRRAHQQHPFIAVWDDHEVADDAWSGGALNHDPDTEGAWAERLAAAKRAWFEWMPVRESGPSIYRRLSYGPLFDLFMLDTRLEARPRQIEDVTDPELQSLSRTLLGPVQKAWLKDGLRQSSATWKLIGNQVLFSELIVGWAAPLIGLTANEAESLFLDSWDGHPAERSELIQFMADQRIENIIFLSGDLHSSFAFEVVDQPLDPERYDPVTGAGAVAIEFAPPSITAANFDETASPLAARALELQINRRNLLFENRNPNPHLRFVDLDRHGYTVLTISPEAAQADFYFLDDVLSPDSPEYWGKGLRVTQGQARIIPAAAPAPGGSPAPLPAPALLAPDPSGNMLDGWFYTPADGWSYTDDTLFPYLWLGADSHWYRFYRSLEGGPVFVETGPVPNEAIFQN